MDGSVGDTVAGSGVKDAAGSSVQIDVGCGKVASTVRVKPMLGERVGFGWVDV